MEKLRDDINFNIKTKLYNRRWLQLGLFFVLAALNSMHWMNFTIIGNIISRYYDVSMFAVDWTALSYHATYLIMVLPTTYLTTRVGLRWTCLIGATGNAIGSWIKYFSVSPDDFVATFIGQSIVAASQAPLLTIPSWLAATWFSPNEAATATAIGFFGIQCGIGASFLITPIVVKNHKEIENIGNDLSTMFLVMATCCTVINVAIILVFQEKPFLPPSETSALKKINQGFENEGFWSAVKRISTIRAFIMIWNSYGITTGVLNAASTLLNPLYLSHFENGEGYAGILGFSMSMPGSLCSIIFARILDRTKKFKTIGVCTFVFLLIGVFLFAVGLTIEIKWLVFLSTLMIGTFSISCEITHLEWSAEATYPEPEELSSGLLIIAPQIYGTFLATIVAILLRTYGDMVAHACLVSIITLGIALTIFTNTELRRENARIISERIVTLLP